MTYINYRQSTYYQGIFVYCNYYLYGRLQFLKENPVKIKLHRKDKCIKISLSFDTRKINKSD